MYKKALELAQNRKKSVKIESKPENSFTKNELITLMLEADNSLTEAECECAIKTLLNNKEYEAVKYTVGVDACGNAIKETVLKETVSETEKETEITKK